MSLDKVLYTDGRGITVTDSTFQVNKTSYQLNGIIKHGLLTIDRSDHRYVDVGRWIYCAGYRHP